MQTPANTAPSNDTPAPSTTSLSHDSNRYMNGWCLLLELLLLSNRVVLHILSLNVLLKFLLWLLLRYNMADYWVWLHSIAVHNGCNCITLWGV